MFRRAATKDSPPSSFASAPHCGRRLSEVEAFDGDGKFHSSRQAGWISPAAIFCKSTKYRNSSTIKVRLTYHDVRIDLGSLSACSMLVKAARMRSDYRIGRVLILRA